MERSKTKLIAFAMAAVMTAPLCLASCGKSESDDSPKLIASYSFENNNGYSTYNAGTGRYDKLNYIYSDDNAENLVKEPSAPLLKRGVKGNALYMDGFSVNIETEDFTSPTTGVTLAAWVAPRVFENLPEYNGESEAKGHPRLTAVINHGNIEMGAGLLLRLRSVGTVGDTARALQLRHGKDVCRRVLRSDQCASALRMVAHRGQL